jgi:uncharacterized membrane protein YgaE (UPF0421/DUF939 family)
VDVEQVRHRFAQAPRVARRRVRPSAARLVEAAVAAAIAWLLASLVPGHPSPVFAPIATLIALTASPGQRGRQAAQLILGILIGIVLSDLFVVAFGRGTWQLALIVLVGMVVTTAVGLPSFMVSQVAIWGVIVLSLHGGYLAAAGRFVDGLIGVGVALVFSQLLFPVDPLELVESRGRPVYLQVAEALRGLAAAVEDVDEERAREALATAERLERQPLREALSTAHDVVRRAPRRRGRRSPLESWRRAAAELDASERDLVVLATGIVRAVRGEEPCPGELVDALRAAAEAYERLPDVLAGGDGRDAFERCARLAADAARAVDGESGFGLEIAVRQLGALVRDARRAAGGDEEEQELQLPTGV